MGRGRWWAAAASAFAFVFLDFAVGNAADTCIVVDQRNLVSDGNIAVLDAQIPGQTFVTGIAGQLVGIEVAPLVDTITPAAIVSLDLYDGADRLIGTVSRTAVGFPPGAGTVPLPLAVDAIASGYFDLTPLAVDVAPGTALAFRIRHDQPQACDPETETCVSGIFAGEHCWDAWDCAAQMRLGTSTGNAYPNGAMTFDLDGSIGFDPGGDLAFKTFVAGSTLCPTATPTPTAIPTSTATASATSMPTDVATPFPDPTATASGPCPAAPSADCLRPRRRGATIGITTPSNDAAGSRLRWKWRGTTFPMPALGDPSAERYALCLYDAGSLVAAIALPTGEVCPACWHATPRGFTFRDGAERFALDAVHGKVTVQLGGRAVSLPLASLADASGPVDLQLVKVEGDECWGSTFPAPFRRHDERGLVDRSE